MAWLSLRSSLSTTGGVTSAVFTFQVTRPRIRSLPVLSGRQQLQRDHDQSVYSDGEQGRRCCGSHGELHDRASRRCRDPDRHCDSHPATPAANAEQNPTGTVVFYHGTTVVGSGTLTPLPNTDSSTATLTVQTLPGGVDSLTAVYQGDSTYGSATSNLLTINVQGFTLTPSPYNPPKISTSCKAGAGSESFVITSVGGYTSAVQVICTVPTQDDMTCAVSPQQVTPTATVTFVVQTYVTGGHAPQQAVRPGPLWPQAAAAPCRRRLLPASFWTPRARLPGPSPAAFHRSALAAGRPRPRASAAAAHRQLSPIRHTAGRGHAASHRNSLRQQCGRHPDSKLHRQRAAVIGKTG